MTITVKRLLFWAIIGGTIVLGMAGAAHGSGFAVSEQSVKGLGYANAGVAAVAEDASTIFFNPAGLVHLDGRSGQINTHIIAPTAEFRNQGSVTSPAAGGVPLTGGNGGDGGEVAVVPNLYYAHSFSDQLKFGIGFFVPFGLATDYDPGWVGRYHGLRSEVRAYNINPAIAYRINKYLSLGLGISAQLTTAELTNAIDYGTLAGSPQALDGKGKVEGEDWGFGANVGVLVDVSEATRFGIHYRSHIDHTLKGDATFETPPPAAGIAQALGLVNTTARAKVSLPETVSVSGYHAINERWAVLADVTWTKWSRVEELRIQFDSGAPDSVTTLGWDDTWRFSAGMIFKPVDRLNVRWGVAYDQTPVPSDARRTPRIPDNDRWWLTVGAGWQFNDWFTLDGGYAHLFIDDPRLNQDPAEPENALRGALIGKYEDVAAHIFSVGASFHF